jgi:hypothetical protein
MELFTNSIEVLSTLVIGLGAALGVWGLINLLEGYGNVDLDYNFSIGIQISL